MPNVAVYVRAAEMKLLQERGLRPKDWVRSAVRDALEVELNGGIPPIPHYEVMLRRETRVDILRTLRQLVQEGTLLDEENLDNLLAAVERGAGDAA